MSTIHCTSPILCEDFSKFRQWLYIWEQLEKNSNFSKELLHRWEIMTFKKQILKSIYFRCTYFKKNQQQKFIGCSIRWCKTMFIVQNIFRVKKGGAGRWATMKVKEGAGRCATMATLTLLYSIGVFLGYT